MESGGQKKILNSRNFFKKITPPPKTARGGVVGGSYDPHRSRDSVSPVCGIFTVLLQPLFDMQVNRFYLRVFFRAFSDLFNLLILALRIFCVFVANFY